MSEQQGMSRAAKRRKKEHNKVRSQSSSGPDVADGEDLELFHSTTGQISGIIDSREEEQGEMEGIISILNKKEVVEITSDERAQRLMKAITHPLDRSEFYLKYWQKTPHMMSSTQKKSLFNGLIDMNEINQIINRHALDYPHDILIGKYQSGISSYYSKTNKKSKESVGEIPQESYFVSGDDILKAIDQGYSIRLNHPQKYDDTLWKFLSALEHEFNTPLTCEVYVSPIAFRSLSQGFAPHLTQGDSFIIQCDGVECWTIYGPNDGGGESSSEHSSKPPTAPFPPSVDSNFFVTERASLSSYHSQQFTLAPGDCLYVPQGFVVESSISPSATTQSSSQRCVHLSISCNHSTNIIKFLNLITPQALFLLEKQGMAELKRNSKYETSSPAALASRSLPASFFHFMGVQNSIDEDAMEEPSPPAAASTALPLSNKRSHSENLQKQRDQFRSICRKTLLAVVENALKMLDPAADQISKEFLTGRLPVPLTAEEEALTYGGTTTDNNSKGQRIYPFTKLRMLRPGIARAMVEDGMVVVYHCMDNSREMFGGVLNPLEFELDDGPAIEALLHAYPDPVMVMDLPHPSEELEDKIGVAEALFKEGFLVLSLEDRDQDPDQEIENEGGGEGEGERNDGGEEEEDEDDDSPF